MTSTITKIVLSLAAAFVVVAAGFSLAMTLSNTAEAAGSCGGCAYSQSDYYSQNSYYSQGSYSTYTQADYYSQNSYYTQADYYSQSTYYTQGDYYSQGSYSTYTQADYYTQGSYNTVPKCIELKASKLFVEKGEEITLSWKTENAASGIIMPGQIIAHPIDSGSVEVTVGKKTTYVLTVFDDNDDEEHECEVTVDIKTDTYSQGSYSNYSQGSYGGGGSKTPKCDLDISVKKIQKGKTVTIKWNTTNATDVILKDNHGKTLIDTDDLSSSDKKDFLDGKIDVKPVKDTTYTLIAERGSKDKTCKAEIEVEDEIVVLESRDQKPFVQGIALTHVPYTGFEAGPVLTFIFYGLLTLWALFVAYVLVIKKKVS